MLWTLVVSGLLMGLAGSPHCTAMCGAACTALSGGTGAQALPSRLAFHLGRALSYSAGGAVVAAGVGSLATLSQAAPALRPLWTLLHVAALALGLWLLGTGRQPAWVEAIGSRRLQPVAAGGWQRMHGPAAAGAAGSLWVAWPCGLLQSALVVAALADGAGSGALVMAAFATGSSVGLVVGPALWARLFRGRGGAAGQGASWAVRAAGAALGLASAWALGHGLWQRVIELCTT